MPPKRSRPSDNMLTEADTKATLISTLDSPSKRQKTGSLPGEEKQTHVKAKNKEDEENVARPSCGGYIVGETIGEGGNSKVKLVTKDGIRYAMKIFKAHE